MDLSLLEVITVFSPSGVDSYFVATAPIEFSYVVVLLLALRSFIGSAKKEHLRFFSYALPLALRALISYCSERGLPP